MSRVKASDDQDLMEKAAREALTQPSDSAMWDDRLYQSHGAVISWADRGDDVLAESNYYSMLAALEGAVAHDETGASEARSDDVLDTSASHWLVGSLRTVFVRVRDDAGEFTPAFREAVDISTGLQDYPIIDESDYSEREYAAWESVVDMAVDDVRHTHSDVDTPEEDQVFYSLFARIDDLPNTVGYGPDEVSWDQVQFEYDRIRDEHFEWLARWHLYGVPVAQLPLPL